MAGKPGLPRPESVGAGSCWKGLGLGGWDGGRETPALLAVLGGEDELHFTEPGVWWEGDEAGAASWGDGTHLSPQLHSLLMFPHWWHSLQSWRPIFMERRWRCVSFLASVWGTMDKNILIL